MSNLAKLGPKDSKGCLLAVIETPKGNRTKLDYDPKHQCFTVSKVLPEGLSFPFAFGFIPSTLGDDGDPLDVILLLDETLPTGTVVPIRLIGVMEAVQKTGKGKKEENDRLFAVGDSTLLYKDVKRLRDLPKGMLEQIEAFFVTYNREEGKRFKPKDLRGPARAMQLVQQGARRLRGGE